MATYPIKMLKDEEGKPFVPLISIDSIKEVGGETLEQQLDKKLETTNLIAGTQIALEVEGNNVIISNSAEGTKLINNLDQTAAGVGALDAAQGKVLKESIPEVINNLTTIDSTKALSAHQGYVLAGRSVPVGGGTGQVLMKSADDDYSVTWGDAADPNAIIGDGSIKKIVELTYEEYQALETIDPNTEYHIYNTENGTYTYINEGQINEMIENSKANMGDITISSAQSKNLLNDALIGFYSTHERTFTNTGYYNELTIPDISPYKVGETYTYSYECIATDGSWGTGIVIWYTDDTYDEWNSYGGIGRRSITFTVAKPISRFDLRFSRASVSGSTKTQTIKNLQIEKGSIMTSWASYRKYGYNPLIDMGKNILSSGSISGINHKVSLTESIMPGDILFCKIGDMRYTPLYMVPYDSEDFCIYGEVNLMYNGSYAGVGHVMIRFLSPAAGRNAWRIDVYTTNFMIYGDPHIWVDTSQSVTAIYKITR